MQLLFRAFIGEIPHILEGFVFLWLGWIVSQRVTYRWNIRQKQRELQLTALQGFYAAYGEFFAVWKLWNHLDCAPDEWEVRRWELQKRAASAEATVEGIFVRLASERVLKWEEIRSLGRFRQGFQRLREAIQDKNPLAWHGSGHPEYIAFKSLAVSLSSSLAGQLDGAPSSDHAAKQLMHITSNEFEDIWLTNE